MDFERGKIEQARTEHEILLEDPKKARKRRREDKKRRKKYKFTAKHHAKLGIIASLMAILEIALIVFAIVLATNAKGEGGFLVGALPFLSILMATIGIILSSLTFKKADTIYTYSWVGLISSIVVWLFVAVILVIGL